ncbi:hypothetical protein [Thalassotalea mangrovi]|uniref:Uncharacterized protein n=1 Tax=Thalassotalea mangrovi TaxID=2572245 RepID=A0A4U1BAY4_9GAMM|nr:hypothetical protein [Thalassotalea mangrovi]TKB47880.1 hypothetical protein E8M12_00285 [Thalassotalea mangrovi]
MKKLLLGLMIAAIAVLAKMNVIFDSSTPEFQRSADTVLTEAMTAVNRLCLEKANGYNDSFDYFSCIDTASAFEDLCRERILSEIPEQLTSPGAVSSNTLRMQKCVVPSS